MENKKELITVFVRNTRNVVTFVQLGSLLDKRVVVSHCRLSRRLYGCSDFAGRMGCRRAMGNRQSVQIVYRQRQRTVLQ